MRYVMLFFSLMLLAACGTSTTSIVPTVTPTTTEPIPSSTPSPTLMPSATPSATPTPSPTATPSPTLIPSPIVLGSPTRIQIAAIDLDRELVAVGLDAQRVPIVPNHDVGWYNLSAELGQGENIVLWGHVLRFRSAPNIPAPFARIKELAPGDAIMLSDARGTTRHYIVTRQVWVTPDQVEYILPQGREMVTLVSCIGDKVVEEGGVEMTHRLITIAEPVGGGH